MSALPPLEVAARQFADDVSGLLNGTVTNGIRLSAVIAPRDIMQIACGITKRDFTARAVPLTLGRHNPHAYLHVAYYLKMDEEGSYPAVTKSHYGLYLDQELRQMLVHWDYERNPNHGYPAAHVQVNGESQHLSTLCQRARDVLGMNCPERQLRDAHFPVGGRRFRPSLEDVVEFLILENLVEPHPGWEATIDAHRAAWEELQLRAAVRRHPDVAKAQLREDGNI